MRGRKHKWLDHTIPEGRGFCLVCSLSSRPRIMAVWHSRKICETKWTKVTTGNKLFICERKIRWTNRKALQASPGGPVVKNQAFSARDAGLIPGLEEPTCHRASEPRRHKYRASAGARGPRLLTPPSPEPVLRSRRSDATGARALHLESGPLTVARRACARHGDAAWQSEFPGALQLLPWAHSPSEQGTDFRQGYWL